MYDFEVASTEKLINLIDNKLIKEQFVDKLIERLKEPTLNSQYILILEIANSIFEDMFQSI